MSKALVLGARQIVSKDIVLNLKPNLSAPALFLQAKAIDLRFSLRGPFTLFDCRRFKPFELQNIEVEHSKNVWGSYRNLTLILLKFQLLSHALA